MSSITTRSHNKKRNVILMYEFLIRTISKALLENDKKTQATALRILKNNFKRGTELYKEFRIANALYKTTVSNPGIATSILQEAKQVIKNLDEAKLQREKSFLIKEVNYAFDQNNFYDQPLNDYRILATIQTLFNEWRETNDLSLLAEYEDKLATWLTNSKEVIEESTNYDIDPGTTRLVTKIMTQKINDRYKHLNEAQKRLLKLCVLSESNPHDITQHLISIKETLLSLITPQLLETDQRLSSIQQIVLQEQCDVVDDVVIARFMNYAQLVEELQLITKDSSI